MRWLWLLVLALLLAWAVYEFLPAPTPSSQAIPYSVFLEQVRSDNVAAVTLQERAISGSFRQTIPWPPATPEGGIVGGTPVPASTPGQPVPNFTTNAPAVEDPRLLELLDQHGVTVNVTPPGSGGAGLLFSFSILPLLLLGALMIIPIMQARRQQNSIFGFGRSRAQNVTVDRPNTSFNDVAGQDEAKRELAEIVDFLKEPEKYLKLGARIPRGVLLVGPPGSGKTLMARAVAGEAGVPFFQTSGSEFVEMFVGVGASRVRDLFTKARSAAPAILFVDEIDAVGRQRGAGIGGGNDEREQTLNQLLVEMDGFDRTEAVVVVAATNRPDVLDPALLRPGRFDRQVTVGLPDRAGRVAILKIHSRQVPLAPDIDLDVLARGTPGFSGADLANLVNEAALQAARLNHARVTMDDFDYALDRIMLGLAQPPLADRHEREVVAYHEGGHALVAGLVPEADPVRKVTIMPRGMALGVTEQLPVDDRRNYSRGYLLARLAVMLGGRSAEEIVFGEITTGAANDLKEASRLARRMVTQFGMSDTIGALNVSQSDDQPFLGYEMTQNRVISEELSALIDREVKRFVEEAHSRARNLLLEHRAALDELANLLLKEETVSGEKLKTILKHAGAKIPTAEEVVEAITQPTGDGRVAAPSRVEG